MNNLRFPLSVLLLFTIMMLPAQNRVHSVDDIKDMRASSAEYEMERMGYELSSVDKVGTWIYQFWYNERKNECMQVSINDGRVKITERVSGSKCNERDSYSGSSSDRYFSLSGLRGMRESEASDRLQREGYRVVETDGKGRGMVDLYWYNERERECVKMEVDDDYVRSVTKTSTSYCRDSGDSRDSYSSRSSSMDYLDGWGALKAYDELEDRGFRETKSHKDGGKTYRVWYNSRTGECVKTLSQDKRITEVVRSNRCDS